MFKASIAIHKTPAGVLNVLACSEDADGVVDAYNGCNDAGEVQLDCSRPLAKAEKSCRRKTEKQTNKKSGQIR